jgi:hypothetical protein
MNIKKPHRRIKNGYDLPAIALLKRIGFTFDFTKALFPYFSLRVFKV